MSSQPEQSIQTPTRTGPRNDGSVVGEDQQQDVWVELFGIVHGLAETVQTALQAFTPCDDKAVSATTKKRLALRSIQGLKQSQNGIETLVEHLKALQAASQTWQRSMMYASKSHQELMEQIESTTEELHKTTERLRSVEAQRLAAVREAELLRGRAEQQEAVINEARTSLKQKEEELETSQFALHELQSSSSVALQDLDRLRQAAAEADARARVATAAMGEAKTDAVKAHSLAERHQQVIAKLTADNLVFLMQLKKAEADLATANQERMQLRLAAEQQRGPWFDQVRAGVEERVRQSLQRSQELEACLEQREAEHTAQMEALREQQVKLEEQLSAAQQHGHKLQLDLDSAMLSKERSELICATAEAAAGEVQRELDHLAAENRVLQESVRSMRQECTERWMNEQAALGQVDGFEQRIGELQQALSQQAAQMVALQRQLDAQTGINRQLMARKEEVEWQLMAAMAKIDGEAAGQPLPLNLRVSGLLQVGGPDQQQPRRSADEAPPAASIAAGPGIAAAEPATGAGVAHGDDLCTASGDGGGGNDARQQIVPASGPSDTRLVVHQHPTLVRPSPACTAAAANDGERRPPPSKLKPAGSPGSDVATITHTALCEGPTATSTGCAVMLEDSYPQHQPQPRHRLREGADAVGGGVGAVDAPTRWNSLEGASTVVSSPPTSVAFSTELGTPEEELSLLPIESNRRETGDAIVTIRTVSSAWQHRANGRHSSGGVAAAIGDTDSGYEGTALDGRGVQPTTGMRPVPCSQSGLGQLERRGSLHDGGDVWMADRVSSSSDDSDVFITAGAIVKHESHVGEPRNVQTPAQQAQLYQLQQRLQLQLQGSPAMVEGGGMGRKLSDQGLGKDTSGQLPTQAMVSNAQVTANTTRVYVDDDDDTIRVCAPSHNGGGGGGGAVVRSAITMRSTPTPPAAAVADVRSASYALLGGRGVDGRNEPGVGIFSITKGNMLQPEAVPRSSGSPTHPALFGKLGQSASSSPRPVTPPSSAAPAVEEVPQRMPSERVRVFPQADVVRSSLRNSAGGAPADTDPIPVQVRPGPPFYANAGPLDSDSVAALERWKLSTRGQEVGQPAPARLHSTQPPVPCSPARSSASMRSPRSPCHPALLMVVDRHSGEAAGSLGPTSKLVPPADAAEHPRGFGSESVCGTAAGLAQEVAIEGKPMASGAAGANMQAAAILRQVASSAARDEHVATGMAEAAAGVPARPRVSFHGLIDGGQVAAGLRGDVVSNVAIGGVSASSLSSSSSSLDRAGGNGSGMHQSHKPGILKSVRFSDHDPEPDDEGAQLFPRQRESQEQQTIGSAVHANVRAPAAHPSRSVQRMESPLTEATMEAARPFTVQHQTYSPDGAESSQQYRSRGSVQHPAMLGISAVAYGALDAAEATPSKRYSAAGVTTTAAPRACTG